MLLGLVNDVRAIVAFHRHSTPIPPCDNLSLLRPFCKP